MINGIYKAYPFSELAKTKTDIVDLIANKKIIIRFNQQSKNAQAFTSENKPIPVIYSYLFAWIAFHPDSLVYKAIIK